MQNCYTLDERNGPDFTRGIVKEKSCDRPPVDSPISKSAVLIETFQKAIQTLQKPFPDIFYFPLTCIDSRMTSRLNEILGDYSVLGKSASAWIRGFEQVIGQHSILAEYIVGSTAAYIAGQPLLHEALEILMRHIPNNLSEKKILNESIRNKISQTTFPFADVDLRIKLAPNYNLSLLQIEINKMRGCRTELYKNKTLIVYVGEEEEKSLDIVIYTELDTESALTLDDFKVNISRSNPEKDLVFFESTNPWKWWCGLAIGFFENNATDAGRVMLRLLCQLSKGRVSVLPTEKIVFPLWHESIKSKLTWNKEVICQQFDKQQKNHDKQIPLVDYLLRLRTQQLIRDHSPNSTFEMKELANVPIDKRLPPFIQSLFHVMNTKGVEIAVVHSLIECIAYLALYEAWQRPFEVKLVKHEGKWVQRLRFRGNYKRDLLVRFDIPTSLKILKAAIPVQWEKIRVIIDSLWFRGFSQRTQGPSYKKILVGTIQTAAPIKIVEEIKTIFLQNTGKKEIVFAEQSPLAEMQIEWSQNAQILLAVGKIVFNHYHHDLAMRHRLCWSVVNKCMAIGGYYEAAEMVTLLREAHEDPVEGYTKLFTEAILKGGNAYLYKACNPFPPIEEEKWFELSQSKKKANLVVEIMNQVDVSAELFLEVVRLLKIKDYFVSESILVKILNYDKKRACEWIQKKDQLCFVSEEYVRMVSEHLLANKGSFNPVWIKDFIISKRFRGCDLSCKSICQYLVAKPIEVMDKATVLKTLQIKDNSLWQLVANEYISKGESWPDSYNQEANLDYETLVMWHQIIENADNTAFVNETLAKIPQPQEGGRDIIRGLVLVRLLKNWEKRPVAIEILKKLDLSKKPIPWENVIQDADKAECILKALYKVSLPLYSALFRTIKPKEPFYASYWVAMLQSAFPEEKNKELLAAIDTPMMTECLLINEHISLPLFKRVTQTSEGILFILQTLTQADQEIFCSMIHAAANFDDEGALGARVFLKYYDPKHHVKKSKEFIADLAILAKKLLVSPQGDAEAAGSIWKVIKHQATPQCLPPYKQLVKLVELQYTDWVIEIINKAQPAELETLDPEIYVRLIRAVPDLDKRCMILECCRSPSPVIQKQWEIVSQGRGIDIFSALKLLKSAQNLQLEASKVHACALHVLSEKINTIDESVLRYLIDLIPKLNTEKAFELWEALRLSKRVEKDDLWSTGLNILGRNPQTPPYQLLSWMTQNSFGLHSDEYYSILKKIVAFPLEERIRNMILASVKKEALKQNEKALEIYWGLDCDENLTINDISNLKPNLVECQKSIKRLLEKINKEGTKPHLFESAIYMWVTLRTFDQANYLEEIYGIISTYISTLDEEEKDLWISRIITILLHDIDRLNQSPSMQVVCRIILTKVHLMDSEDQIYLLSNLIKHQIHLDLIWNLITPLACSTCEEVFNVVMEVIEKLDCIDVSPTRIIFQSHSFPNSIPKFDALISRMPKGPRRSYFEGILSSAKLKNEPNKENAISYIHYLNVTFSYLDIHYETERKEWKYISSLRKEFLKARLETSTPLLFYMFVASNLHHPNLDELFYEPEVFKNLLQAIDFIALRMSIGLMLTLEIARLSLEKSNPIAANMLIQFIFLKLPRLDHAKSTTDRILSDMDQNLYTVVAKLIIKFFPSDQKLKTLCAGSLINMLKKLPISHVILSEECDIYLAYMLITGQIDYFDICEIPNGAVTISKAIDFLCKHPHHENLMKAQHLLDLGIREILIMHPKLLRRLNHINTLTILKNYPKDKISEIAQLLLLHVYFPKGSTNLYDMTEQQFIKFFKQKYEKCKYSTKEINAIKSEYQEYKRIQQELIYFNLAELIKFGENSLGTIIECLGAYIFNGLLDPFKNKPEELDKISLLLKNACEQQMPHQKLYSQVASLLYRHAFLPLELWRPYFNGDQIFEVIVTTRKYYHQLESLKDDKKAILELKPDQYCKFDSKEIELAIRYQWILKSFELFENAEINEDLYAWMVFIRKEIIKCFDLALTGRQDLPTVGLLILEKLFELNQIIAKKNALFANEWLQEFINAQQFNWEERSYLLFLSSIYNKLQQAICPELLPSLPHLEQFETQLSTIHHNRNCIDAYHRVLSLGCTDETTIWKAIQNAQHLYSKIELQFADTEKGGVIFNLSPNPAFSTQFGLIYNVGIQMIIDKYKKSKDGAQFIRDLRSFRLYTEESTTLFNMVEQTCISSDKVFNIFYNNISIFEDKTLWDELMPYLHHVHQLIGSDHNLTFAESNRTFLLYALICGPDSNDQRSNKYLREIALKTLPKLAKLDISLSDNDIFICYGIYCSLLLDLDPLFEQLCWTPRIKAVSDSDFRYTYCIELQVIISILKENIKNRPDLIKWYTHWISKAEGEILLVKQRAQALE